jgi:hypothetical protein
VLLPAGIAAITSYLPASKSGTYYLMCYLALFFGGT